MSGTSTHRSNQLINADFFWSRFEVVQRNVPTLLLLLKLNDRFFCLPTPESWSNATSCLSIQTPLPVCFSFIYELLERAHLTYQTKTAVYDALEQIVLHLAGRQFGFILLLLFLSVLIWCKNDVHVLHQNQECSSVPADCRSWQILSRYSWNENTFKLLLVDVESWRTLPWIDETFSEQTFWRRFISLWL